VAGFEMSSGRFVQCNAIIWIMSWRDIGYAVVMAVAGAIAFTTVIDVGRIAVRFWHQPAVVGTPHPQQKIVTPIL
jgi:hypothetical protein